MEKQSSALPDSLYRTTAVSLMLLATLHQLASFAQLAFLSIMELALLVFYLLAARFVPKMGKTTAKSAKADIT